MYQILISCVVAVFMVIALVDLFTSENDDWDCWEDWK